ncbi:MAG: Rieske 2Fe-2S domain-containing protein [Bryobacteraceae bacterium]
MAFVKVASLSKLPPGSVTEFVLGEDSYAICNAHGEIAALNGICPHAGGPLGQGALNGDNLVCPWHAWEYNCHTGVNDYDDTVIVETYQVKIEGDDILADLPESI